MSSVTLAIIALLLLLGLNAPIYISIIFSVFLYFVTSPENLNHMILVQRIVGGVNSIPLLAVPFFVTAGVFMNYTGITKRMVRFCEVLTGHLPGGLAQVNVVLSTLMGGLSGSSLADAAMQSKILVPEMVKRGYSPAFSAAVTGASALITPIIPPGIALIIFGYVGNVSIGRLFLAGILPGSLTCLLMMLAVHLVSIKRGYTPIREKRAPVKEIIIESKSAFLALLMPVVIIGGIRLGIFTPTETGSIAILYALILGAVVYKEIKLKDVAHALVESVSTCASILLIIAAASAFGWFLTWEGIPQKAAVLVESYNFNPYVFLMILNILLLIVGMFIEGTAAMLVLIPLFMPISRALGINDVHFGMIFIFNMAVGSLSPPMGTVMFTTCSITKVKVADFIKEAWPFYLVLLIGLIVITYVPAVSLLLPNLIFN